MTSRHRASEEKSSARSTRRANQRHAAIIAKMVRPTPEDRRRAFALPRR